jgi:hypothetical protein
MNLKTNNNLLVPKFFLSQVVCDVATKEGCSPKQVKYIGKQQKKIEAGEKRIPLPDS